MARGTGTFLSRSPPAHSKAGERLRLFHFLQLPVLPQLPRREGCPPKSDPGADRGARPGGFAANLPRPLPAPARHRLQLPRGAGDDLGRFRQSRCVRRRGGCGLRATGERRWRLLPAKVRRGSALHAVRRPHRSEQGLPDAPALLSAVTARRRNPGSTCCSWAENKWRFPPIRGFVI